MATLNFTASGEAPSSNFGVIPAADYNVQIIASEVKPAKTEGNSYLQLELEVLDGEFKGRKLWEILNLWNNNPTAAKIAKDTLDAICYAIGVVDVPDSAILHMKPMLAKVAVEVGKLKDANRPELGRYDDKNKIKAYGAYAGPVGQSQGPFAGLPVASSPQFQAPVAAAPVVQQFQAPAVAPVVAPAAAPVAAPPRFQAPGAVGQGAPVFAPPAQAAPVAPVAPVAAPNGGPVWAQP